VSAETKPSTSLVGALALLTLPSLDELTERQGRGIACVWDAIPLRTEIAVDLGERPAERAGASVTWYPRSCRRCTHTAAYAQLCVHAASDACPKDIDRCATCRGFLRVMREYRR
jgi:hypothetical protein